MSDCTRFEVIDNIGIMTLCRPPVNAVNEQIKLDLIELFESVNDGRIDVHAIILCSDQKGFCGGADTKEWYGPDMGVRERSTPLINRMQNAIYRCNVPVIAAVNTFAIGMGFGIVSLCDVILCDKDAWFMFPEINVGSVGAPTWLTRIMPEKMARYYLMTGEKIPAEEMYRLGCVLKVVEKDNLLDEAMEVARANGARGGTIVNARGVAKEEAAAFFGIAFHADKEILMIVVEKDVRNAVLNALYKEMGMDKKSRGIVFSLPVSDVAGLVPPTADKPEA